MAPVGAFRHLSLALGAAVAALGSLLFIAWKIYFRDVNDSCIGWRGRWEQQLEVELGRNAPGGEEEKSDKQGADCRDLSWQIVFVNDLDEGIEGMLITFAVDIKLGEPPSCEYQVLVLGLDGAGKSSIIHYICSTEAKMHIAPTQGFNSAQLQAKGLQMDLLEVGGSQNLRSYWNHYLSKAHVLVFVVDSADGLRLHTARQELHGLLAEDPQLPLIVLANKQDKSDALSVAELHEELALHTLENQREFFLLPTSATDAGLATTNSVLHLKNLLIKLLVQV